jgi:integrase
MNIRTRPLPDFLKRWYDKRTRKTYLFFRRRGYPSVPLPQPVGSDEFWVAYNRALANKQAVGADRSIAGSISAALAAYYASPDWSEALGDATRGGHRPILEKFRQKYGMWPLRQITANFIEAYIGPMKPHPARTTLKVLRRFLKHAKHDVTSEIKSPKAKTNKHESWPLELMERYEAHHPIGSKARLCFALARYTGASRSDLVRLGSGHITAAGEISIVRKKTGVPATIEMLPALCAVLDVTPLTGLKTFLVNGQGNPYSPNELSIAFREWCSEAGIPPDFRCTACATPWATSSLNVARR